MNTNTTHIEEFFEHAKEYGRTTLEILQLQVLHSFADILSKFVVQLTLLVVVVLFIVFGSLGLALYIGAVTGVLYYGLLAVAAFYVFLAICLFIIRKRIHNKVYHSFLSILMKHKKI